MTMAFPANILFACALVTGTASPALSQSFFEKTHLLDLRLDMTHWSTAEDLSQGGYELSDGSWVSFADWYRLDHRQISASFLTDLDNGWGLTWGLTTGARAEKLRVEPGLQLGIIRQKKWGPGYLTWSISTVLWGDLREKSCTADYGAIGGIQEVNCRLAAEIIAPEETLDYLVNVKGYEASRIGVVYEIRF